MISKDVIYLIWELKSCDYKYMSYQYGLYLILIY